MKLLAAITFILFSVAGSNALASWSINTGAIGVLNNASGNPIDINSIGILVADLSNGGISDPFGTTLSAGASFSTNSNNLILSVLSAVDIGGGYRGFDLSGTSLSYAGDFGPGDNLYLVWFPLISVAGSVVGYGIDYGVYGGAAATVSTDSTMAWVGPADGFAYELFSLTTGPATDFSLPPSVGADSSLQATLTTVPEPSSALLLGLGAAGLYLLRRRKAKA
jgi:hypothetical protein